MEGGGVFRIYYFCEGFFFFVIYLRFGLDRLCLCIPALCIMYMKKLMGGGLSVCL
jgi:hypothetical protein